MQKLISALAAILFFTTAVYAVEVTFVIENLNNNNGSVKVSLYDHKDNFLKKGKALVYRKSKKPLSGNRSKVSFDLSPGTYAAAIYHDENGNSKLDTNFLKIPKEGYGFSNQARAVMGPPDFEAAAFRVEKDPIEMKIKLKY